MDKIYSAKLMVDIISIKPVLAVFISAIAALFILFYGKKPNIRESCSIVAGVLKLAIVLSMIPDVVYEKNTLSYSLFTLLPGIEIGFRVDAFGLLFAMGASLLWIATSIYSIGYMRSANEQSQTRYFACFSVALTCTLGWHFPQIFLQCFFSMKGLQL